MTEFSPAEARRSRYLLLALMLIPVFVVLAATFVFYTGVGLPKDTRNKGVLLTPPVQINDIRLLDSNGKQSGLEGQKDDVWTFLTVHDAACDDDCRQQFWMNRQTRIALGKYQSHVRRVWLVLDGMPDGSAAQWLAQEHPDVMVLRGDSAEWRNLLSQTSYNNDKDSQTNFFLVDPRGFVMMYYTTQNTYKDVMADMKFLLKGVE